MTRQSKQAKRKIIAATFTALHKQGQKGPARTSATHGKVKTARYLAAIKRAADLEKEAAAAERAANKSAPKADGKKPAPKKTGYQGKNADPAKAKAKPARKVEAGTISK